MTKQQSRPPAPPDVALQLRQEAQLGCCRCGAPFVEYHHIVVWEAEEHFRPEDMMALCPYCHAITTAGAMPVNQQRSYKAKPFNVKHGNSKGTLFVNSDRPLFNLAGNLFGINGPLIRVDGEDLIALTVNEEGAITLSCSIFDENDQLIFELNENEWLTGA